jgi:hypothetical protein
MSYCENFRIDGKRINELEIKENERVKFNTLQYKNCENIQDFANDRTEILDITSNNVIVQYINNLYIVIVNNPFKNKYIFSKKGILIKHNDELYINKSGFSFFYNRGNLNIRNILRSVEILESQNLDICIFRRIMHNCGLQIREYYFNNNKIGEDSSKSSRIDYLWNPKDLNIKLPDIIKYIFLHIYFLLKTILGNKLNNKDLRQYIFGFLYTL